MTMMTIPAATMPAVAAKGGLWGKLFQSSFSLPLLVLLLLQPQHSYHLQGPCMSVSAETGKNVQRRQVQQQQPQKEFESLLWYLDAKENNQEEQHLSSTTTTTTSSTTPLQNRQQASRKLDIGDFERFNELFRDAAIAIPAEDVSQRVLGFTLTLQMHDMYCEQISIGDVQLTSNFASAAPPQLDFNVQILSLAMVCNVSYHYRWGMGALHGSGTARADTNENTAQTVLSFTNNNSGGGTVDPYSNTNFILAPPDTATVASCSSQLNIYNMEFRGDIIDRILDTFQGIVRNFIENAIEKVICRELSSLGTTFIQDAVLKWLKNETDTYMQPVSPERSDPLVAERNMPSTTIQLVDYGDLNNTIGSWVTNLLERVHSMVSDPTPDPTSLSGQDLGINVFLRENLLDADGALTVSVADLQSMSAANTDGDQPAFDPVLFQSHDALTETVMTLDSIRVWGLDSFTSFEPLVDIGKYTLQNSFTWKYLTLELDMTVDIRPSLKEDSIWMHPNPDARVVENIQVSLGLDQLTVVVSILLALDQDKLGAIQLGSILQSSNLLACFISLIHQLELTGLNVTVVDIKEPVLAGFISPGIDRLVTSTVMAAFSMYEPTFLKALPAFFQGPVRNLVQDKIFNSTIFQPNGVICAPPDVSVFVNDSFFVDFRDLFLSQDDAKTWGASGKAPYGDLGPTLYRIFRDRVSAPPDAVDGALARINTMLVNPITATQSGVEGRIQWQSDLFSFSKTSNDSQVLASIMKSFSFQLSNVQVDNLNTIVNPVTLIEPSSSANRLQNSLTASKDTNTSVDASVILSIALEGPSADSPLAMSDVIQIKGSIAPLQILGDIVAMVSAPTFLQFPVRNLLNADCWLATMPAPELNVNGTRVDPTAALGLYMDYFFASLDTLHLTADCVNCTSPGLQLLPDLLNLVDQSGAMDTFAQRAGRFIQALMKSNMVRTAMDRMLYRAPFLCPFSPEYNNTSTDPQDFGPLGFPALPAEAVDTLLFTAVLGAEIGLVAIAESHNLKGVVGVSDPLSAQNAFIPPQGITILDWTNLGTSLGIGSIADTALNKTRTFLNGQGVDGLPRVNSLMKSLSNDEGVMSFPFGARSVELDDLHLSINALRVKGLDTFTTFDVLESIAPQTLQNTIALETLWLELDISADIVSTPDEPAQNITLSFGVQNMTAEIALFAALDAAQVGSLPLGSFLRSADILPCLVSTAHGISIPQLDVSVGAFLNPLVTGLMNDTDAAAASSIDVIIGKYRTVIEQGIPIIFKTTVRDLLDAMLHSYVNSTCPDPITGVNDEFIDFQKLFNASDDAEGGSYGTVPAMLKDMLNKQLLSADPATGMARLNDLIRSFTTEQSGESGTFYMSNNLFDASIAALSRLGINTTEFRGRDARFENLDTFKTPLVVLEPNTTSPFLLDNRIELGAEPKPFRMGMKYLQAFAGGDPMLSSSNELDVLMELSDPAIFAVLFARIDVKKFLTLPLRRIVSPRCWLSTFATPTLDERGVRLPGEEPGLAFDFVNLVLSSLQMQASCSSNSSCTSAGFRELPVLLEKLKNNGVTDLFSNRLVSLAAVFLQSEFVTTLVDRLLADSAMRCSIQDPNVFQEKQRKYPLPDFPSMSMESMEGLAFAATYLAQVGTIILAETHTAFPSDLNETTGFIKNLTAKETKLVNFTNLGSPLRKILKEVRNYLQDTTTDSSQAESDMGINVALRSFLLDDSGSIAITPMNTSVGGPSFQFSLAELRLRGIDSFTNLNVLNFTDAHTIQNKFDLKTLTVEADLVLHSEGEDLNITVSFTVSDVTADISIVLGIDETAFGDIVMMQLLNTDQIPKCLLSAVDHGSFSELDVSVGKLENFNVSGFHSPDIAASIETLNRLLLSDYGSVIASAMRPLFKFTLKAMVNNLIQSMLDDSTFSCPVAPRRLSVDSAEPKYLDFRDLLLNKADALKEGGSGTSPYGNLIPFIIKVLKDNLIEVDPETGLSALNGGIIARLTKDQSNLTGRLLFPGDLVNKGTRVQLGGLDARVTFRAYDAYVTNLDSFGTPLSVLNPVNGEPFLINNTVTAGVQKPVTLGVRFLIDIGDTGSEIRNDLDISLDISKLTVILEALLKVSQDKFFDFPVRDFGRLNCWLATMPAPPLDARGVRLDGHDPSLSVADLVMSLARLKLNISCLDCSSPGMLEFASLLSTPEAAEDSTRVANELFDYITKLLGGPFLQLQLDRLLNDAKKRCPHDPAYKANASSSAYEPFDFAGPDDSMSLLVLVAMVSSSMLVLVLAAMLFVKLVVRRRHTKFLVSLPSERVLRIWRTQQKRQEIEKKINEATVSMSSSPEIPLWLRWTMPVIIVANIGFFLSGHLSLGATVNIKATLADQSFTVSDFYKFSILTSTIEIWNAGGKELAIFILIFSGIWPYTKQIITLVLWFAPPHKVTITKRGSILLWLDTLAKWSMVDVFTLIVTLAAFRVSVQSPDVAFLPDNFYRLDLLVVPLWGLYANFIAQLISQISSHYIIHYHRRIEEAARNKHDQRQNPASTRTFRVDDDESRFVSEGEEAKSNNSHDDEQDKLCDHAFGRPHRGESDKLVARPGVNPTLVVLAFTVSVLVTVGTILPSFSLDILGIVGILVESGQEFRNARTGESIFTISNLLFEQAAFTGRGADYVGLGSLSILLISSVLLVPIIQSWALIFVWFRSMGKQTRNRFGVFIEILQAWQYAEVYLLAVFVASWQLGPVSEFMVNSYCENLDETFAKLVYYGLVKEEDAQCFRVNTRIQGGFYILAIGAVLMALLNTFVMKAVAQYFREKDEAKVYPETDNMKPTTNSLVDTIDDDLDSLKSESARARDVKGDIEPIPVLFTDKFRWLLVREDNTTIRVDPHTTEDAYSAPPTSALLEQQFQDEDSDCFSDSEIIIETKTVPLERGLVVNVDHVEYEEDEEVTPTNDANPARRSRHVDEYDTRSLPDHTHLSDISDNDSDIMSSTSEPIDVRYT